MTNRFLSMFRSRSDVSHQTSVVLPNTNNKRMVPVWLVFVLSTGIPLLLFLPSLAPVVTFGDSGEFLTQIATLGIAHPPGFPLYLLLGKLFSFLPWGAFAWKISFMSAVFASLTSLSLSYAVWLLTKRWWLALLCPLLFVLFPVYWDQATMAEVYTLNTFALSAIFVTLLLWRKNKKTTWLFAAAFLAGLGATNHAMSLLYVPGYVLFLLASGLSFRHWRRWLGFVLLFLLGLSVYLYLPIRSAANPAAVWSSIHTPAQILQHITRQNYVSVAAYGPDLVRQFRWNDLGQYGIAFVNEATDMLGFVLWPFFLIGLFALFRRDRSFAEMSVAAIIVSAAGSVIGGLYPYSVSMADAFSVLFLQALLPFVLLVALGMDGVLRYVQERKTRASVQLGASIILVGLLVIILLPTAYTDSVQHNRHGETLLLNTARSMLQNVAPNGILLFRDIAALDDGMSFSLLYLQKVEHMRTDVTVVAPLGYLDDKRFLATYIGTSPLIEGKILDRMFLTSVLASPDSANRPIFSPEPFAHTGLVFPRSDGLLYQLFRTQKEADAYQPPAASVPYTTLFQSLPSRAITVEEQTLLSVYYYNRAFYFAEKRELLKSGRSLSLAIAYDPDPFSVRYYMFIAARNQLGLEKKK